MVGSAQENPWLHVFWVSALLGVFQQRGQDALKRPRRVRCKIYNMDQIRLKYINIV